MIDRQHGLPTAEKGQNREFPQATPSAAQTAHLSKPAGFRALALP
jgi:hypothetical protein